MKNVIWLLLTMFSVQLTAKEIELPYEIVSNEKKDHVKDGFCEVIGSITESGSGLIGITVKTLDKKHFTSSGFDGGFKMLIPAQKTKIYAYHYNYDEVVTDEINFKSGHQIKINFNLYGSQDYEVEKPVVYIYGPSGEKIHIELETKGEMKFTYPKYNDGWDIKLGENGTVIHEGKSYPYLFWDGKQNLKFSSSNSRLDGSLVLKNDVVQFLERQLGIMGLNKREMTDFITYWAPRMINYEKVFVQFMIDDAYDEIATLKMTPKPESSRRIYLKFTDGSSLNPANLSPQKIDKFNRKGLTYIEWGGSELPKVLLKQTL